MTDQPFVLVPLPDGVTGLHFTDTHVLACGACHATIAGGVMPHGDDCAWIAQVVAQHYDIAYEHGRADEREANAQLADEVGATYQPCPCDPAKGVGDPGHVPQPFGGRLREGGA